MKTLLRKVYAVVTRHHRKARKTCMLRCTCGTLREIRHDNPDQLKLCDVLAEWPLTGRASIAGFEASETRRMAPASTSPPSAFCMRSTAFAKASTGMMIRWRKTGLGLFFSSFSVADRLTISILTIEPVTVISPMPSA